MADRAGDDKPMRRSEIPMRVEARRAADEQVEISVIRTLDVGALERYRSFLYKHRDRLQQRLDSTQRQLQQVDEELAEIDGLERE